MHHISLAMRNAGNRSDFEPKIDIPYVANKILEDIMVLQESTHRSLGDVAVIF